MNYENILSKISDTCEFCGGIYVCCDNCGDLVISCGCGNPQSNWKHDNAITRNRLIEHGFAEGKRFFTKVRAEPYLEVSVALFDNSCEVCAENDENLLSFPGCKTMEQLKALWEMLSNDTN